MKCEVKITRTLITDNKKTFKVGGDIAFTIYNKETNHHDRYIGEIKEITDVSIIISKIEINRIRVNDNMTILLEDIEKNSCNYVYYD